MGAPEKEIYEENERRRKAELNLCGWIDRKGSANQKRMHLKRRKSSQRCAQSLITFLREREVMQTEKFDNKSLTWKRKNRKASSRLRKCSWHSNSKGMTCFLQCSRKWYISNSRQFMLLFSKIFCLNQEHIFNKSWFYWVCMPLVWFT